MLHSHRIKRILNKQSQSSIPEAVTQLALSLNLSVLSSQHFPVPPLGCCCTNQHLTVVTVTNCFMLISMPLESLIVEREHQLSFHIPLAHVTAPESAEEGKVAEG